MPLENLIGVVLNKATELKNYFHKPQEEPIGEDGITEYDIDRIRKPTYFVNEKYLNSKNLKISIK